MKTSTALLVFALAFFVISTFITSPEDKERIRQNVDAHMEERQERIDFIDNVIRPD